MSRQRRSVLTILLLVTSLFSFLPSPANAAYPAQGPIPFTAGQHSDLFDYYGRNYNTSSTFNNPYAPNSLANCTAQGYDYGSCSNGTDHLTADPNSEAIPGVLIDYDPDAQTYTPPVDPGSVTYFLPNGDTFAPDRFALQTASDLGFAMQSFRIDGLIVGTSNWEGLVTVTSDPCPDTVGKWCDWGASITGSTYSAFRITPTDRNALQSASVGFDEVELYGFLAEGPGPSATTTSTVATTTTAAPTTTTTDPTTSIPSTSMSEMQEQTKTMKLGFGLLSFCAAFLLVLKGGGF